MRRLAPAFLVAASRLLVPSAADACSCIVTPDACKALGTAHAVFEATVDGIEPVTHVPPDGPPGLIIRERRVRLRDVRAWRGDPPQVVMTGIGGGDCGYVFRAGTRYLIEAYRRESDGSLETGICSQTRPIDEAAGLLTYLESLSQPSTGGRVWGSVTTWSMARGEARAIEGAHVSVRGASDHTASIGPDGRFMLAALPSGPYTVSVELPADRPELLPIREETLTLGGAYACAELTLVSAVNGRIQGIVVDVSGRPMPGAFVILAPPRSTPPRGSAVMGATTDANGQYSFERIGPDRYVVGVSIVNGPSPGGLDVAYARHDGKEEIELAPGAQLTLDPIVTRRVSRLTVRGTVRTATGEPAAGAVVRGAALGRNGPLAPHAETTTDADGTFAFNLWRGVRYRVDAAHRPGGRAFVDLVVSDEPIVITLRPQ